MVALVALCVTLSACTAARKVSSTSPTATAQLQTSTTPTPAVTPTGKSAAASSTTPGPFATGELKLSGCPGFKLGPAPVVKAGESWINALVPTTGPYGDCDRLVAGKTCKLPFRGSWELTKTPKGYLVYQVFENGAREPLQNLRYGPIPTRGQIDPFAFQVRYTAGSNAKSVTFRWLLLDATGNVAAKSRDETLPIPTCTEQE